MTRILTAGQARRLAIAAQGLARPRPDAPNRGHFRRLVDQLGVIQIDSVNVVARTHYLPPFARLGAYDPAILDQAVWGKRPEFFEYWGHMASFMPMRMQPLFRWRMAHYAGREFVMGDEGQSPIKELAMTILAEIRQRGPVTGGDFAEEKRVAGWWNWSAGKRALEWLFAAGEISTSTRVRFERHYDLTERVIPSDILNAPTPTPVDAIKALMMIGARAMGVATLADLKDYWRTPPALSRQALAELVEDGALEPVSVQGWDRPAYLDPAATFGRKSAPGALLSPFDNLIWFRERTERLFGARFRIEIYVPQEKRVHGYYVLPFLLGEAIAARVDLKADRQAGVLRVQASHLEPGSDQAATASALAGELATLAGFLGLGGVAVMKKGDLSAALSGLF